MINAPMTCLTLKETVKGLMVGHKNNNKSVKQSTVVNSVNRRPVSEIMQNAVLLSGRSCLVA